VHRSCPLPLGRGWRGAPGEGSPLPDLDKFTESWGGLPSSGAPRHLLPEGEGHAFNRPCNLQFRISVKATGDFVGKIAGSAQKKKH
jgi:hypothetical protein